MACVLRVEIEYGLLRISKTAEAIATVAMLQLLLQISLRRGRLPQAKCATRNKICSNAQQDETHKIRSQVPGLVEQQRITIQIRSQYPGLLDQPSITK